MDKPRRIEAEDCAYTIGPFEAYDADAMDAWLRDEVFPTVEEVYVWLTSFALAADPNDPEWKESAAELQGTLHAMMNAQLEDADGR